MKKQKPELARLSLKKTMLALLNSEAQEQIKGGLTGVRCHITLASQCNNCIPATEFVSCRCV